MSKSNISYASGLSRKPLLGETIGDNLRRMVQKYPKREALVVASQGYRVNYLEFWRAVEEVAKGLLAYEVRKGDRVGIWAPNRFEWVLVQYATARIGAIMVNINPAYKDQDLKYVLDHAGIRLLIASEGFRETSYMDILMRVSVECGSLEMIIFMEQHWAALIESGRTVETKDLEAIEASLQFDDPINIQYTSGTTGFPKGATLTHHNILNNGYFVGETLHLTQRDRVCIPVPFYHCFGMVMGNLACTSHGACMVIPGAFFEPETTMRVVQEERCSVLYGVPTMFIAELNHPRFEEFDFSSLRTGIMAGSPCPVETMKLVQSVMHIPEMTVCYGMTETSPVSTQSATNDPLDKRVSTVGRAHPFIEIKIVDPETGAIVQRGERGEFCTRGYSVMLGYWENEEATRKAIDSGGWMHTGDLAVMDAEGYVAIVGRSKDMIIRGGENISPREIEEYLMRHVAVADVQVIGLPDVKYGEEVMAWVKLKHGAVVSEDELSLFCRGQIATFKIPRYWKFVDGFPMTVTGKVRKVEMREVSGRELGLAV